MKKKAVLIAGIIGAIIVLSIIITMIWYKISLKAVASKEEKEKQIQIENGVTSKQIISLLKENELVRSELATKIYIKLNKINNLQAGKYVLRSGLSTPEIIKIISSGEVINENINITFLEGKNIRQIASKIAGATNNTEEDVFSTLKDKEYINSLIEKYWFLPKDILDEQIYYPLEGYLAPNTYTFKNKEITVKEIFEQLLNQTDKVLTKYKKELENKDIHKVLTVASIVELEGKKYEDRQGVAKVIYNRMLKNMSLGSDVTTYYAAKVDMSERDLYQKEINDINPYNTRGPNMNGKLPVGPIANPSEDSIKATLNPVESDYLYFVSDLNGKLYFAKNYEGHQTNIKNLKSKGLWYTYDN